MLNSFFYGMFDSSTASVIAISDLLLCIGCSLLIGLILSGSYMYRSHYSRSFVTTLALLPALVCVVIMMVNGNIGAGVAVAGAFSLVRFRSVPGSAKEIGAIFLAMGAGLVVGMGYLGYGILISLLLSAASMLYTRLDFGGGQRNSLSKILDLTIPEDLDYPGVFDPILTEYASRYELVQVKTTHMGSLFRLTYHLTLKTAEAEKELIDKLRCRNGNLEIMLSRQETIVNEL